MDLGFDAIKFYRMESRGVWLLYLMEDPFLVGKGNTQTSLENSTPEENGKFGSTSTSIKERGHTWALFKCIHSFSSQRNSNTFYSLNHFSVGDLCEADSNYMWRRPSKRPRQAKHRKKTTTWDNSTTWEYFPTDTEKQPHEGFSLNILSDETERHQCTARARHSNTRIRAHTDVLLSHNDTHRTTTKTKTTINMRLQTFTVRRRQETEPPYRPFQ